MSYILNLGTIKGALYVAYFIQSVEALPSSICRKDLKNGSLLFFE